MDTQNETKPSTDRGKTGTPKKPLSRLIIGALLIAAAANLFSNQFNSDTVKSRVEVGTITVFGLMLAAIGVWSVVSYLRSGKT